MNPTLLKDSLPLESAIGGTRVASAKRGTPVFKGILYERTDDGFGNPLLRKVDENTVVVGGAIQSLEHLCNVDANWKPATLNEIYGINDDIPGNNMNSFIALFGVGTGGSGLSIGSVVAKDIKSRDIPELIPLRVSDVLTGDDADKYYFKKDNGDGTFNWYLKEFTNTPLIKTCWKDSTDDDVDGTEVTEEIFDSQRTEGLQTFAEFILDLNTKDVREYFESIGDLTSARYNSIGLFIGEKVELPDGTFDYVNVRLFSYLNIDNKSVKIKTVRPFPNQFSNARIPPPCQVNFGSSSQAI